MVQYPVPGYRVGKLLLVCSLLYDAYDIRFPSMARTKSYAYAYADIRFPGLALARCEQVTTRNIASQSTCFPQNSI